MHKREIDELISEAGPRPPLPEQDLTAIREAARAEWQELVTRHSAATTGRRGHALTLAASLVLVIAAAWWWMTATRGTDPISVAVVATVERSSGFETAEVEVGSEILVGMTIETGVAADGVPQRLALRLSSGASLRVDGLTELGFPSENEVELRAGAVYFDGGGEMSAPDPLTIKTEFGAVHHVGTQYEVRLVDYDDAVRVRVREGEVELESGSGSYTILAGEQFELAADGRTEKDSIRAYDPAWNWATEVSPGIEIDGISIRSYLEWLSRETGRELVFESDGIEDYAVEHVISAPPDRYSLEDSLEIVRTSSDLDLDPRNGTILVFGPGEH